MSAVMKNHRKFNSFHFCKYANVFLVITPIDQSEIYGKRRAPDTGYPRAASRAITASKKFRQTTECPPPQRDHSRHKGGRGHYSLKDNGSRQALEKSAESKEKETGFDEGEETGPDRSSQQQRHYRRGRPERRIIEESANDPYCE